MNKSIIKIVAGAAMFLIILLGILWFGASLDSVRDKFNFTTGMILLAFIGIGLIAAGLKPVRK